VRLIRAGEPLQRGDIYLRHLVLGVSLFWLVGGIAVKFISGESWEFATAACAAAWAVCLAFLLIKIWLHGGEWKRPFER
jgi:hypothetical protein